MLIFCVQKERQEKKKQLFLDRFDQAWPGPLKFRKSPEKRPYTIFLI